MRRPHLAVAICSLLAFAACKKNNPTPTNTNTNTSTSNIVGTWRLDRASENKLYSDGTNELDTTQSNIADTTMGSTYIFKSDYSGNYSTYSPSGKTALPITWALTTNPDKLKVTMAQTNVYYYVKVLNTTDLVIESTDTVSFSGERDVTAYFYKRQ